MDVLMLVMSDVAGDSRVLREAAALAGRGHPVHIIGKDVPAGFVPPVGVSVASVSPASVFRRGGGAGGGTGGAPGGAAGAAAGRLADGAPGGAAAGGPAGGAVGGSSPAAVTGRRRRPAHLRLARWLLLPRHRLSVRRSFVTGARRLAADRSFDVVHAHDFTALELGASLAAERGARLVYDAHEFWSGRQRHGRPTPLERFREARTERRLGARADAVLTVSDGIADRLRGWGWREVTVVHNTFPPRPDHPPAPPEPRGIVYAGRIGAGRDLETVLAVARRLAPFRFVLMGPVDASYVPGLDLAAAQNVPAAEVDAVDDVLRAEGLSLITLTDTCLNHRLALPNKLFHAVRAGVPVIAADLPELRRVVKRYGIGCLYRPGDARSLAAAVAAARTDYAELTAAVAAAAGELNWERDAASLLRVYDGIALGLAPAGTARS